MKRLNNRTRKLLAIRKKNALRKGLGSMRVKVTFEFFRDPDCVRYMKELEHDALLRTFKYKGYEPITTSYSIQSNPAKQQLTVIYRVKIIRVLRPRIG